MSGIGTPILYAIRLSHFIESEPRMNTKILINRLLKKIFTPKIAAFFLLSLPAKWSAEKNVGELNFIGDSEFSVTSQHGEDGVLLFLMARLSKTLTFAEIGAHACESNCLYSAKTLKMKGVFFRLRRATVKRATDLWKWLE